jgi:hypothetical protein
MKYYGGIVLRSFSMILIRDVMVIQNMYVTNTFFRLLQQDSGYDIKIYTWYTFSSSTVI